MKSCDANIRPLVQKLTLASTEDVCDGFQSAASRDNDHPTHMVRHRYHKGLSPCIIQDPPPSDLRIDGTIDLPHVWNRGILSTGYSKQEGLHELSTTNHQGCHSTW